MDEIKKRISLIDFNDSDSYHDAQGHRDIYSSVHSPQQPSLTTGTNIRPPDVTDLIDTLPSQDVSSIVMQPPPCLVFYGARNILLPSFIFGQIPDLLNLLTIIESFRQFSVVKSDEVLELQMYYEQEQNDGREQDVRLLAANEVCVLQGFLNTNDAQRREYVVLVRSLTELYIHYLRTAPESCLMWKRFNDFFPGSIEGFDGPSELLFHIDLSEEEKVYFESLKVECQEWLRLVTDWDRKREKALRKEGVSGEVTISVNDFHKVFPPPYESSDVVQNIKIYMGKVEDMVGNLEQWFPPSSHSNMELPLDHEEAGYN